jgi:glutathione S-transferase
MKLLTIPHYCSTATHIVLQWSKLPFEVDVIDSNKLRSVEYLEINPQATVPALIDGDLHLAQNVAIMTYVSDLAPGARLFGDGSPRGRAEVMRWLTHMNSDLHPAFAPLFAPGIFAGGENAAELLRPHAVRRVTDFLGRLDTALKDSDWLTGSRSCADAYLFVVAAWTNVLRIDISGLTNLSRHAAQMRADDDVRTVLAREGIA